MKKQITLLAVIAFLISCNPKKEVVQIVAADKKIEGTWKLFYGEVKENDSVQVKDISNTDFIKIINKTHFAFFNQPKGTSEGFYGGGGTYSLEGSAYVEKLNYISVDNIRGHEFPFTIEIKGDTLIQYGLEEIKEANIKRDIIEKYIRIK
jgi:hypothetical protein